MTKISRERFSITGRDAETGQIKNEDTYRHHQTIGEVFDFLLFRLREQSATELTSYAVVDAHGRGLGAESWMEQHSADHVAHVYSSAHENVKGALETLWPELHLALTNLEVNYLPPVPVPDPLFDPEKEYWWSLNGNRKHRYKLPAGLRGDYPISFCGREIRGVISAEELGAWGLVCTICVKNEKIHKAGGPR